MSVYPVAYGLISIDDGKNKLFVNASVSYAWDSNIFANENSTSDSIITASLGTEFTRRAGLIAVNGSVYVDASSFVSNTDQNFLNPRLHAEFSKQTGRTTGALTFSAARQSTADTAANLRTESWAYSTGLNFKYPIIERYSFSGGLGYSLLDFNDNTILVDLTTYSANLDLFYILNTERDLIASYRVRHGDTSANSSYFDHAFTVGVNGRIISKLSGNLRLGYQIRQPSKGGGPSNSAITASSTATWALSRKMNVVLSLAKDFSTTSTNITVDSTTADMNFQYALNSKLVSFAGLGYGMNRFLGAVGAGREDQYFTWNIGAHYTLFAEHLKLAFTYTYFQNWSSLAYSTFQRNSFNLTATSQF